jgi:hypothetical protein
MNNRDIKNESTKQSRVLNYWEKEAFSMLRNKYQYLHYDYYGAEKLLLNRNDGGHEFGCNHYHALQELTIRFGVTRALAEIEALSSEQAKSILDRLVESDMIKLNLDLKSACDNNTDCSISNLNIHHFFQPIATEKITLNKIFDNIKMNSKQNYFGK